MTLLALADLAGWPRAQRAWRQWQLRRLVDPAFAPLWGTPPPDEYVALDCETTGLDRQRDEIIAVGAVRIHGQRILTSQRLQLLVKPSAGALRAASVRVHGLRERDLAQGLPLAEAMARLLQFVGPRPLVGYYLEFDVAMINRAIRPLTGLPLPQARHEVSALYYDHKKAQLPPYQHGMHIDLRFDTLMRDLALPQRPAHDAFNDAVMAAMAFVKLRALLGATRTRT